MIMNMLSRNKGSLAMVDHTTKHHAESPRQDFRNDTTTILTYNSANLIALFDKTLLKMSDREL
jgi:hypothetical protein